jgi:hypothetical protein
MVVAMTETRFIAVVLGSLPDRDDPMTCGESTVVAKRTMQSAAAARRWINGILATTRPAHLMYWYGMIDREEWSDADGCWYLAAQSDTISVEERDRPTKFFPYC